MRASLLVACTLSCLLIASVAPIHAQSGSGCVYENYDFSSLMESTLAASDDVNTYFVRPCSIVSDQPECLSKDNNVTVCAVQTSGGSVTILADETESPAWALFPGGAQYSLTQSTATCYADKWNLQPIVTNVQFVCAQEPGTMSVDSSKECAYTFTIPTPLACSPPPRGCSFNGVDYSSFSQTDLQASGPDSNGYWLHVCGDLTSQPGCTAADNAAAACMVAADIGALDLGDWSSQIFPVWGFINNDPQIGVQYVIQSIESFCTNSQGANVTYTSIVEFGCVQEQGPITVARSTSDRCTFVWQIPTPLSCPKSKEEQIALE